MHIDPKLTWTIELTSPELRLIMQGLSCSANYENNSDECLALMNAISRQKAGAIKSMLASNEKLFTNLDKASGTKETTNDRDETFYQPAR